MRKSDDLEPLWFSNVVEAIFVRGLGDQLTPRLHKELLELGIDVDRLQPAYPITVMKRALQMATQRLFPSEAEDEALRQLGALSMRGYAQTLIGQAVVEILKIIGVRRSLLRMHTNLRSGNNYLETSSQVVSPTCVELSLSDASGIPSFYRGIFEEGGRMAHAKNLRITSVPAQAPRHTFRVEWDE